MKIKPPADVTDLKGMNCATQFKIRTNVYLRESVATAKRQLQLRQSEID